MKIIIKQMFFMIYQPQNTTKNTKKRKK
jgi:hypothetical protein